MVECAAVEAENESSNHLHQYSSELYLYEIWKVMSIWNDIYPNIGGFSGLAAISNHLRYFSVFSTL